MTRKILFYILLSSSLSLKSQTRTSLECLEREFQVIVHVVTDSFYYPSATYTNVRRAIDSLNKAWAPICVKFNLCEYRLDSNYNFVEWNKKEMEDEYIALNHQPRIINIVVVRKILDPSGVVGYSSLEGINKRAKCIIVVSGASHNLWIHEMGHFFGLKHPFEPTLANADNQNCQTMDDGVCDTPPDPDPTGNSHVNCIYNGQFKDPLGKYYNPLVENYMSYYGSCGKSFTHMQYERMIKTYKVDKEAKF